MQKTPEGSLLFSREDCNPLHIILDIFLRVNAAVLPTEELTKIQYLEAQAYDLTQMIDGDDYRSLTERISALTDRRTTLTDGQTEIVIPNEALLNRIIGWAEINLVRGSPVVAQYSSVDQTDEFEDVWSIPDAMWAEDEEIKLVAAGVHAQFWAAQLAKD